LEWHGPAVKTLRVLAAATDVDFIWVPRGSVLRCEVLTTPEDFDDPCITIDGRDFTARKFLGMLSTFEGWGMRIEIVPADELHDRPKVEVDAPVAGQPSRLPR